MKNCIQGLLTADGECKSLFSSLYLMRNHFRDYGCKSEQADFYKKNCVDINNPCNVHYSTKLFVDTGEINENFVKCMFFNDVETLRTFFHYGITCNPDQEISDRYDTMKEYLNSGYIFEYCPEEFNELLDDPSDIKTKSYCKQYVELYDEYCL